MENDFISDFTLVAQTAEIFNHNSLISTEIDQLLISQNNHLNFWNVPSFTKNNSIGTEKKRTITGFCRIEEIFVLSYDDGSLHGLNYENEKIFGCRISKKKIVFLINKGNMLYLGTVNGNIYEYDVFKCEITRIYKKQTSCNSQIAHNKEYFVVLSGKSIIIFEYSKKDPVKIQDIENQIVDCAIISKILIILDQKGQISFFNLQKLCFFTNHLNIKTAKSLFVDRNSFYVISPQKKINQYQINPETLDFDSFSFKITEKGTIECDIFKMFNYGNQIFIFSLKNQIFKISENGEQMGLLPFHNTEILNIKIYNENVFSLSEEKLIKWQLLDTENEQSKNMALEIINSTQFKLKTSGLYFFKSQICVFDREQASFLCLKTLKAVNTLKIPNITAIASQEEYFAIGSGNNIALYDKKMNKITDFHDESTIVYIKFSNNGKILGVSNLNNKINIYQVSSGAHLMSLYGHSLPVKFFDFSSDDRSLLSCSADKLIKLWGVEYAECRKTIIENAEMALFMKHNKNLFLAANDCMKYYHKNEKIKEFKTFKAKWFDMVGDYLIIAAKYQIYLYKMNDLEFLPENSSEVDEELEIEDQKKFDRLESALEKSMSENTFDDLLDELLTVDLAEIEPFVKLLDRNSISCLLKMFDKHEEISTITSIKIFLSIMKHHKNFCQENAKVYSVYCNIYEKVKNLHQLIKTNIKETRPVKK